MCSIAGVIKNNSRVEPMIQIMKHRAPDDAEFFEDEYVKLGMGRLKIIDLKSPGLTLYREDNLILCYNGEIYNYIELRKELSAKGWKFNTASDTEVLLKSWREWGLGMFDRLNGMFAFAIYDSKNKKLWLARDIAGEKPLYYAKRGDLFAFASEAKAFEGVLQLEARRDEFFEAFQHCHITTLWKNVYELPAAHYMEYNIRGGEFKIKPYWEFRPRKIVRKTAVEELESLLEDAVKIRTRSDVPYALYYSRGIDSSLISKLFDFKNKFYFDDSKNWREDFFRQLDRIVWHLDFPVGSLSSYPLWKLAEQASKKVKVVVSGEGADEIFGGYVRYLPVAREWELQKKFPSYAHLLNKYYPTNLDGFTKITARNANIEFVKEQIRPYFEMFEDPINAMGFADFKLVMPSLLQMGDRMAGAFGLENRCPFLDRRIIEFGFSLPPELKISGLEQKVILRNILRKRGMLMPLKLEKKGLTIRFNTWFGKKDWDRGLYVGLLLERWQKLWSKPKIKRGNFQLENKIRRL